MGPGLAGRPGVEDVADGAADGVQVPEGHPGLAHHGVQVVGPGVPVVRTGGARAGRDPQDGAARVVGRRRGRQGRLHGGSGHRHHGVDRVGAGRTGDVGDRVVGGGVRG